jgi:hypothetical protein
MIEIFNFCEICFINIYFIILLYYCSKFYLLLFVTSIFCFFPKRDDIKPVIPRPMVEKPILPSPTGRYIRPTPNSIVATPNIVVTAPSAKVVLKKPEVF